MVSHLIRDIHSLPFFLSMYFPDSKRPESIYVIIMFHIPVTIDTYGQEPCYTNGVSFRKSVWSFVVNETYFMTQLSDDFLFLLCQRKNTSVTVIMMLVIEELFCHRKFLKESLQNISVTIIVR